MFKKASSYMEVYGKTALSSFDLSKNFPDQFMQHSSTLHIPLVISFLTPHFKITKIATVLTLCSSL